MHSCYIVATSYPIYQFCCKRGSQLGPKMDIIPRTTIKAKYHNHPRISYVIELYYCSYIIELYYCSYIIGCILMKRQMQYSHNIHTIWAENFANLQSQITNNIELNFFLCNEFVLFSSCVFEDCLDQIGESL